jgi:hypothetical protein
MNAGRLIQSTEYPYGGVSGRFRVWRLPDGRFQVVVDESCGFIIDFDGAKSAGSHDTGAGASISSKDAWFSLYDHELAGLIDALRNAPEGQAIGGAADFTLTQDGYLDKDELVATCSTEALEQRAAAIERRLADYEEELEQMYDEELPGLDLYDLRLEYQARVEHAREKCIDALLKRRKKLLEGMSDEELLTDEE